MSPQSLRESKHGIRYLRLRTMSLRQVGAGRRLRVSLFWRSHQQPGACKSKGQHMRSRKLIRESYVSRRKALGIAGLAVSEVALFGCGQKEPEAAVLTEIKPQPEFVDVAPLPFTWKAIASGDKGPG